MFVLVLKIKYLKIDTQLHGHALRIGQIVGPRTFHTRQILCPVFHIDARHLVALLEKQSGCQRRIDTPTHANIDTGHQLTPKPKAIILTSSLTAKYQPRGLVHHHIDQSLSWETGWLRTVTLLARLANSRLARR